MALCIEPQLTRREVVATLTATIPECTLTQGRPQEVNTLRASIVKGGLTASLVSGMVGATIANGSLRSTTVTGSLSRRAFTATLTSGANLKATLTGKPSVTGRLTSHSYGDVSLSAGIVEASLEGIYIDAYLAVYCPINYITSCFSLGGWDNNLGWDNNQGWKN